MALDKNISRRKTRQFVREERRNKNNKYIRKARKIKGRLQTSEEKSE